MIAASELVHWRCVRPEHRAAAGRDGATLTIHEGQWARCPAGSPAGPHEWRQVDGRPLRSLLAATQPAGATEDPA